jgi:hypothetical protein
MLVYHFLVLTKVVPGTCHYLWKLPFAISFTVSLALLSVAEQVTLPLSFRGREEYHCLWVQQSLATTEGNVGEQWIRT